MRFTFLLCALTSSLALAQTTSSSSSSSSSAAPEPEVPSVVKLASQKVTIPAAQIPLTTLDGKEVHLGDYDSKVVVVSLWGTISNDNSFLKTLESLHQLYRDRKDVVILGINVDHPKDADDINVIRQVLREQGVTYPVLVDKNLMLMAFLNERLRSGSMTRNTFLVPRFVLFSQRFEKMEQPAWPPVKTVEEELKVLQKEVERVRLRK
jgi:hypothetical protein